MESTVDTAVFDSRSMLNVGRDVVVTASGATTAVDGFCGGDDGVDCVEEMLPLQLPCCCCCCCCFCDSLTFCKHRAMIPLRR